MNGEKHPSGNIVTFEFGETDASNAFLKSYPEFFPIFEKLMVLGNKSVAERPRPSNLVETVTFGLTHTCREDFLEILFLCVNGYNNGALKLLRGLYERAVTLEFIVRHPDKAERFKGYAAIQSHRGLVAALKTTTEEDFNKHVGNPNAVDEIREYYNSEKPNFQITDCKKCGTTRTASTWDQMDLASMVHELNGGYKQLYMVGYALPNFAIHATLDSALRPFKPDVSTELVLLSGIWAYVLALNSNSTVFNLNLIPEVDACWDNAQEWFTKIKLAEEKRTDDPKKS